MTKTMRAMASVGVAVALTAGAAAVTIAQAPPAQPPAGGRGPANPPLLMTTTAWEDGGVIPDKYTQAAGPMAVSPELKWAQVPPGTQSFVLLLHDPEPVLNKGSKMDITHWLIWNIPATSTGLQEAVAQGELADGSRQVSLRGQRLHGSWRPGGPVSSLHVRTVCARHETRRPAGHAATSRRHPNGGRERDGRPCARQSGPGGQVSPIKRRRAGRRAHPRRTAENAGIAEPSVLCGLSELRGFF